MGLDWVETLGVPQAGVARLGQGRSTGCEIRARFAGLGRVRETHRPRPWKKMWEIWLGGEAGCDMGGTWKM